MGIAGIKSWAAISKFLPAFVTDYVISWEHFI
jgi:hypothetical protein